MLKTKLRSSLFYVLRTNTPLSSAINFPNVSNSALSPQISSISQLPTISECSRPSPSTACEFLDNLSFSSRVFCSRSAEASDLKPRCWNCGAVAPSSVVFLVCDSCRSIQPVDQSVDYFQIFGLEKEYEIGDVNLESKYKDWQKKLHPDLVHSKSDREREYAAEQSARVIDAYRTLSKPLSRAIYILKLEGVDVDEEDTISEPELLNEIMEIREAVEDASGSRELNQIQSQMQEKLNHWSNTFAKALRNRNFNDAVSSIQRMTYYERVKEEITKKL
ncbi:hypothetical protein IC582_009195 [Cucumis melo]|uniref:Iron-sulfur cluster co-chaperone protein HscB homolog n=1 Tax=Cucumis melo TaxID=3656 RepID=A0A1S3B7N3_CUCME|nr:iron-sulfur cluster co-chaperone protein HscB homolog [Cucumis melo]